MSESSFEFVPRMDTPLIVGIAGPSTSGKTGSALSLAHGFQEILGGDIGMCDTEAGRGNHLQGAPQFEDKTKVFRYKYMELKAPYSPARHTEAIDKAMKQGIKHLIIDSMSHMHESEGGFLDTHMKEAEEMAKRECERQGKPYTGYYEHKNLPAWAKPKAQIALFRSHFTQQKINLIFCFRAKEKVELVAGGKPKKLGFQPIITDDIKFEMISRFLLYPGAKGVPTYTPDPEAPDEKSMLNIPEYFLPIFADPKKALSVWHGRQMAIWAQGKKQAAAPVTTPVASASKPADAI